MYNFEIIFWLFFFYPTDRPNFSSGGRWETKHFIGMALLQICNSRFGVCLIPTRICLNIIREEQNIRVLKMDECCKYNKLPFNNSEKDCYLLIFRGHKICIQSTFSPFKFVITCYIFIDTQLSYKHNTTFQYFQCYSSIFPIWDVDTCP